MPPVLRNSTINKRTRVRLTPRSPRPPTPKLSTKRLEKQFTPKNHNETTDLVVLNLRRSARIANVKARKNQEVNSTNQDETRSSAVRSPPAFDNTDPINQEDDNISSDQNQYEKLLSRLITLERSNGNEEYDDEDIISTKPNINFNISGLKSARNPNIDSKEHQEVDKDSKNQNQIINSPTSGLRRSARIANMNAKKQSLVRTPDVVQDKRIRGTKNRKLKKKKVKSILKKMPAQTRILFMREQVNSTAGALVLRRTLPVRVIGNSFQALRDVWLNIWNLFWE